MGAVSQSIKSYGRRAGYRVGGVIGSKIGSLTKTSVGEKLGRRIGHQAGKNVGKMIGGAASKVYETLPIIGSMKKGGPIRRTGAYLLHKGEYVLNKKKVRHMKTG